MAVKKETPGAETETAKKARFQELYLHYVQVHHKKPFTSRHFLEGTDLESDNLYDYYPSMKALQRDIWGNFFADTLAALQSEAVYAEYSSYEKLLSFYYTLIEILKPHEAYFKACFGGHWSMHLLRKSYLREFKQHYKAYISKLIEEARLQEEIADRMAIEKYYDKALWYQVLFVFHFWANDQSEEASKTDAAIEKAVRLSFDLLIPNAADSFFDLGRFMLQQIPKSKHEEEQA